MDASQLTPDTQVLLAALGVTMVISALAAGLAYVFCAWWLKRHGCTAPWVE